MRFLVLTNSEEAKPLINWLETVGEVEVSSEHLILAGYKYADLIISYNYCHIIPAEFIDRRMINLHISYLPWNRGADPNLWSFLEDTPKGVTIHRISEGLDKGEILFQKRMNFNDSETLESTYEMLHIEIRRLFIRHFSEILLLTNWGSYHKKEDSKQIKDKFGDKLWTMPIKEVKNDYHNNRGADDLHPPAGESNAESGGQADAGTSNQSAEKG